MVPALDMGGPRAMTQADAILHYVIDCHPERDLGADAGVEAHFEFNEVMSFLTGDFHPAFWPFFRPQRFTTSEDEASIEAVRAATQPRVDRVLTYLDGQIGGTRHVYRAKRTVADAYAFVMTRWTLRFPKTWRDYPNVAGFMQAMEVDAAVMKVLAESNR
jgi:glutathione S-transferase